MGDLLPKKRRVNRQICSNIIQQRTVTIRVEKVDPNARDSGQEVQQMKLLFSNTAH